MAFIQQSIHSPLSAVAELTGLVFGLHKIPSLINIANRIHRMVGNKANKIKFHFKLISYDFVNKMHELTTKSNCKYKKMQN